MPLLTVSGSGEDTDAAAGAGRGEDTDSAASINRGEDTDSAASTGRGEDTDSAASTGRGEDTDSAASTGRRECTANTPLQQWWRLDAGSRSVTFTSTLLFVLRSVTRSRVPNRRMRLAAVRLSRW